jgi:hypothetical protein
MNAPGADAIAYWRKRSEELQADIAKLTPVVEWAIILRRGGPRSWPKAEKFIPWIELGAAITDLKGEGWEDE